MTESHTPPLTNVERLTRRATRKIIALALGLLVLFGALMLGPAAIGASIGLWSEVKERLTPPPAPHLPPHVRLSLPAPLPPLAPPTVEEEQ